MKPIILSFCLLLLCACNLYDGQVHLNEKSTVQYASRGVSQKEAKRLGQFLLQQGYFNAFDKRVVYLRKKNDCLEVTFLINKALFNSDKENLLPGFLIWHQWINEEVFPHTCSRILLADESKQALHIITTKAPTQ